MPLTSAAGGRKTGLRKQRTQRLRVDAWAEKLMHIILGTTMTQVAICRYLVQEGIIEQQGLLAFLEQRGIQWSKTSSDEALLPLVTILSRVKLADEPDFPVTLSSKLRQFWHVRQRRTYRHSKSPPKAARSNARAARK